MRACTSLLAAVFAALLLCSEVLKVLHVLVDDVGELMLVVSLQPHLETDPTRNVANASRPNKDVDRRVKANVLYLCKLLNLCADGADGDRRSLLTRLPPNCLVEADRMLIYNTHHASEDPFFAGTIQILN
eukprot:XP_001706139.1 Hypothetical protein GL50803_23871 [Giardia lamblia ATCC 50803]